ncbi:MAG: S8 family serine peptidase, partial [Flavobacteriaceae bacterium]
MLKNYFTTKLLVIFCFFFTSLGFSQTQKQIQKITRDYNLEGLEALKTKNEKVFFADYNETLRLANRNSWPIRYKDGNTLYSIKEVIKGKPIYWATDSQEQAISTRTNFLHSTGLLGLNLEGQDMTVYLWEVDAVALLGHREYDGPGGDNRFTVGDDETAVSDHAGLVTGIIMASGVLPSAKGMAPQAKAIGYNQLNDLAEATAAVANGMLVSNHSYGVPTDSYENDLSFLIGAYTQQARDWDELMFNAPYYLPVLSAGNSGDDNTSNITPLGGDSTFDKLTGDKVSKNNLVVASSEAAVINADGSLSSVVRSGFSSEGPTDDYRIKPDIMGHGSNVSSTGSLDASSYVTNDGTSFSAPNVSGSLILLQQHYNNINNNYMRAATLKGLALHTADDT